MFFQSKKKRLWRARVTQSQQQQQQQQTPICYEDHHYHQHHQHHHHHHHQHQQHHQFHHHCLHHQQQQHQYEQQQQQQYHPYQQQHQQENLSTTMKYRSGVMENFAATTSTKTTTIPPTSTLTVGAGSEVSGESGCYLKGGGMIEDYDDDRTMSSVASSTTMGKQQTIVSPLITTATATTTVTASTTISTVAANVFRNCCGGNPNNGSTTTLQTIGCGLGNSVNEQKKLFRELVGKLKESQLTTLCQAIEHGFTTDGLRTDCVLVPRAVIMGEEPNVIACRMWRWPCLKSATELKRIPSCPNEKDPIYVCCNPTHWSRLCFVDSPPPPYQIIAMDGLKTEDRVPSESIVDGLRIFPGSLTTDGEDSSVSTGWCQLAYWELAQRVGGKFPVENLSVNVFSDQPRGDGMCLKTLAEQRQTATPESVLKVRQKIGLGVTLSQEADGVWLYNRSSAPVFVHSPTLNDVDCWFHVSKVPPGHCLRAFDSYRAKSQSLVWPSHIAGAQTGPVDTHSMRISFAKGWGPNYSRQDVTACPCWLEVLLARR